jgi:hypothetical protein
MHCLIDTMSTLFTHHSFDWVEQDRCPTDVFSLLPPSVHLLCVRTIVVEGAVSHDLFIDFPIKVGSIDARVKHFEVPVMAKVNWMRCIDALKGKGQVVGKASLGIEAVIVRAWQLRVKHKSCWPCFTMQ